MLAISRRRLADLPPPSTDIFTLRAPWCPIPARVLVETLNIDHGLLGVWRMRGVGPKALPAEWTKGRSLIYQVSGILEWLAARRGETFDQRACWLTYLATHLGDGCATLEWVQRLAESEGPRMGDVEFTKDGFRHYLASLTLMPGSSSFADHRVGQAARGKPKLPVGRGSMSMPLASASLVAPSSPERGSPPISTIS